ncbi:hypothetical protein ABZ215_23775 [Amycolatopsis sp. NPDC006131]|uniref:hypothetical protein n=1 Tax=Amycolatopsis sp. NPDC006131 TaxID=3156731 RepID=UPI0033B219EA
MTETDEALTSLLDKAPTAEALARLVRTSWAVLERHRKLHSVAMTVPGPESLRWRHDMAFQHVDRLIVRGQDEAAFRRDLPRCRRRGSRGTHRHAAVAPDRQVGPGMEKRPTSTTPMLWTPTAGCSVVVRAIS